MVHRVALTVGQHISVEAEGLSPQAARHNAARQALELLKQEAMIKNKEQQEGKTNFLKNSKV